jgi:hypothetical protein
MSVPAQEAAPVKYSVKPCTRCGAKELQRKPRTALHKLFAIYPYLCVRCSTRQTRYRFTLGTIIKFSLFSAFAGAIVYLSMNPGLFRRGEDTSQNGAEALARARTAAGGLSAFEQMMIKRPRTTMDNATILRLWRANVSPNVILQMIRTANADYDVSANAIIELKQAGVDQVVILAMIDASYNAR